MRRIIISIATIAAMSCVVLAPSFAQTAEGEALLQAGQSRAAMIRFERAVRDDPDDMQARLGLAKSLLGLGEFERAEKLARVVLRRNSNPEAAIVLAEALVGQDKLGAASDALKKAGDHPDKIIMVGIITGERALQAGDPVGALKAVTIAADHPTYGTMARLIGARAQYARGDLLRAQRLVDEIISNGGTTIPARQLRARLALRAGDTGRAQALAAEIMQDDAGNVAAGSIAIEAALRDKDILHARAVLVTLEPKTLNDPRPKYLEALILLSEGRVREAGDVAGTIETWLKAAPGGAVLLGQIKIDTNRLAQAESILRGRLVGAPEDRAARRLLVDVYDRTDRTARGDALIEQGLAQSADDPILLNLKANRMMARGDFDAALQVLAKAGKSPDAALLRAISANSDTSSPESTKAARAILVAQAALRGTDTAVAITKAQDAVMITKGAPIAQNLLAAAKAKNGDQAGAIKTLDQLIAQHPDFMAAIVNRAALGPAQNSMLNFLEVAETAGASSPEVLGRLASEHYIFGNNEAAIGVAQRVYDEAPQTHIAALILPRLLIQTGDSDPALVLLKESLGDLEREPSVNAAYTAELATLLRAAGADALAAKALSQIASQSTSAQMQLALASAYEQAGENKAALQALNSAQVAFPNDPRLVQAYFALLAKRDRNQALLRLKTDPRFAAFRTPEMRAQIYFAAGQTGLALQELAKAPPTIPVLAQSAQFAETRTQKLAVFTRIAEQAQRRPLEIPLAVLASGLAIDMKSYGQAESALIAGLAAAPNDPILLNNLALVRAQTDLGEAEKIARRAYAKAAHQPAIAETLATILRRSGKTSEAEQILRRARLKAPLAEALQQTQ